ncbi:hypothetical protein OZK63_33480 [Streptomyces sp. UMAF16]|nr:hypothetical protein [Streptomyces sp. UMAF16]
MPRSPPRIADAADFSSSGADDLTETARRLSRDRAGARLGAGRAPLTGTGSSDRG